MGRLFAGTVWDRPPTCERCGRLESECACPPVVVEPIRIAPERQTARLKVEKRAKGKVVTLVSNLDPVGTDLDGLTTQLKTKCGTGGTLKDAVIELQGNHLDAVDLMLKGIGFGTKRV